MYGGFKIPHAVAYLDCLFFSFPKDEIRERLGRADRRNNDLSEIRLFLEPEDGVTNIPSQRSQSADDWRFSRSHLFVPGQMLNAPSVSSTPLACSPNPFTEAQP